METDPALVEELREQVETVDRLGPVRTVAGVDAAYEQGSDVAHAAVVVLDAETLEVVDQAIASDIVTFPYVPGLFSFRELPVIEKAWRWLDTKPDLVVCDGHGLAHPRRFGIACHLGVAFDVPSIGCAKSRLVGSARVPGARRGSHRALVHRGETIGEVLRTQDGVRPVWISIGHRVSLATARAWILRLTPRYRLPETTREADQLVNALLRR